MDAAEYCLKYLAGTADLCIQYGRTKDGKIEGRELNRLWGWVDADLAADLDTRRSHTGYVIRMNGGPISWKSVKQKSVFLSAQLKASGMMPVRLVRSFCTYVSSCVSLDSLNWGLCTCMRTRVQLLRWPRTQVTERGRDTSIRVSISSTNSSKIASSSWCSAEPTRW